MFVTITKSVRVVMTLTRIMVNVDVVMTGMIVNVLVEVTSILVKVAMTNAVMTLE